VHRALHSFAAEVLLAGRDELIAEGLLHRFAMRAHIDSGTRVLQSKLDQAISIPFAARAIDLEVVARAAADEHEQ
jgi:hypothetical protein